MRTLRFNDAMRLAAEIANDPRLPSMPRVGIVRDIYGRLRFAVDAYQPLALAEDDSADHDILNEQRYPLDAHEILLSAAAGLGGYATSQQVLYRDDFSNPATLFQNADWHETLLPAFEDAAGVLHPERSMLLLDRQVIGQDWLRAEKFSGEGHPLRIVFYGLKGGVGRSTALAMLAYKLAQTGKRVLLMDFDLESPGLSGLLLPPERVAAYGLIDWFVEDAVGQGGTVLSDIVSDSPLAEHTTGVIRVAAAMGQCETAYLSKLARVYGDVPSPQGPRSFATRMVELVSVLERCERPDVVLIDSRAGLHDVAAVAIARLADVALLFATDTAQSWQGYRQLFLHWQQHPDVLRAVRERLLMVQALFPESDQADRAERFKQHAYDLFAEHLYDRIEPRNLENSEADSDFESAFNFDLDAEDAPHFPLRIRWSGRLQEFNPLLRVEDGGVSAADIELAFGPFFTAVMDALPETIDE
ncbi:hypothetical protein C6P61_17195 [Malikia spinosa]|uniref:CobQ/CobB/MinD/ParA nucleotide binding domain-containing protein n=1 Tax=Malikia spinosa TaxID=86180 RepID=A0A2S9KA98_9BURK|nr:AAA family ATPase [Malikia spinosa]PRD67305.1 hypothetical protein C6P61_17195 [Malikia spinosa]